MSPQIALSHCSDNTSLLIFKLHRLQSHSRAKINYGLGFIRGHFEAVEFHPHKGVSGSQNARGSKVVAESSLCLSRSQSSLCLDHALLCRSKESALTNLTRAFLEADARLLLGAAWLWVGANWGVQG